MYRVSAHLFPCLFLFFILFPGTSASDSSPAAPAARAETSPLNPNRVPGQDVRESTSAAQPVDLTSSEPRKSILRQRDPVLIEGEEFKGIFDGEPVKSLALYAYGTDGFRQIPFQIDFIGKDGLVIPGHVNQVIKKGVYDFVPNDRMPHELGGRYQLLFMAKDTGHRYPGDSAPQGFKRALEIQIDDPRSGGKGWAYLMMPVTSPSRAFRDYVNYTLIRKKTHSIEQIQGFGYITGFPDPDKPFAYGYWVIPEDAGGSGENLLQTFRVCIKIRILFMDLELDPKKNVIPFVLGYNDGPIRVTRRVFSNIVVGGIKLNSLMGDAKLETESHYYSSYFFFDGDVSLPGFVKKISKIKAEFTTDFSANTTGFKWFNSRNGKNQGSLVDGKMSPEELTLDKNPYQWSMLFGKQGGWANILQMHAASVRPNMNLFYLDDSSYADENEPDLKGTWASTGYYLDKLDEVEEKISFRTNIFAIPNTFRVSDAGQLVDLVYHPLKPSVQRTWNAGP